MTLTAFTTLRWLGFSQQRDTWPDVVLKSPTMPDASLFFRGLLCTGNGPVIMEQ